MASRSALPESPTAETYNLDSAKTGSSLLSHVGCATDVNGHWLVSDTTFCALAELGRGCLLSHLVGRIRRS